MLAKQMPCDTTIETIFNQAIFPSLQEEILRRYDQVHEANHGANGTIAMLNHNLPPNFDPEFHRPAVAATMHIEFVHITPSSGFRFTRCTPDKKDIAVASAVKQAPVLWLT